MNYTKTEKRNHRWFVLNCLWGLIGIFIISWSCATGDGSIESMSMILLGYAIVTAVFMSTFFNGYSLGWELRRIHREKEEE